MRVRLCVFSPTGTGRLLAEHLRLLHGDCELLDITPPEARSVSVCLRRDELLCVLSPVYAQGLPAPVEAWLRRLLPWNGPACVLCTYGGVESGSAAVDAARLLRGKGAAVLGLAELPGPHCYDCADTRFDLSREADWTGLDAFFTAVLEKAAVDASGLPLPRRISQVKAVPQSWLARLAVRYPRKNEALCSACGICKAKCPVGSAEGNRRRCIRCAACVRLCPKGARALRFRCVLPPLYLSSKIKRQKTPRFIL